MTTSSWRALGRKAVADAEAIQAAAEADSGRDLTTEEQKSFDELMAKAGMCLAEAKAEEEEAEKKTKAEEQRKTLADALGEADDADDTDPDGKKTQEPGGTPVKLAGDTVTVKAKSLGEQFISSKSYTEVRDAAVAAGQSGISKSDIGKIEGVTGEKTLVTAIETSTNVSYFGTAPVPHRLMDAITIGSTGAEVMKWYQGVMTSAAAQVPEGGVKPESSMVWTPQTLTPLKWAHHIPITEEALMDNQGMRTIIDTELVDGVRTAVEDYVATQIAALSGTLVQAFDTDVQVTLRRAKTKINDVTNATGILMSDEDMEAVDLATDGNGQYFGGGPWNPGPTRQWAMPIFSSPKLATGTAYMGNLRALTFFQRTPISVRTGVINDQFIKNEMTILAEQRGMLGIRRPDNLIKIALA